MMHGAVVDYELRVHGIEGLRVADASIMPSLPRGNPNLACIMIGEKLADHDAECFELKASCGADCP